MRSASARIPRPSGLAAKTQSYNSRSGSAAAFARGAVGAGQFAETVDVHACVLL